MCGRYALAHVAGFWSRFAVIDRHATLEPRFNIAPTQVVPVIVNRGKNVALMMRWGLVPFWAKDVKMGNRLINARAETVSASPAFRRSFERKRCLVPATGFYEWRRVDRTKVPYYIHLKGDPLFAFAGLYDRWTNSVGESIYSFTIVTTEPNSLTEPLHDRMPVILKQEDEDLWLGEDRVSEADCIRLLAPFPSRRMEAYKVSTEVNSPDNDSKGLIDPI